METKIENFILNFLEEMPDILEQEENTLAKLDKFARDYPSLNKQIGEISDSFIHLNSIMRYKFFQWGILVGKISERLESEY
jgi:hypothetical protein